MRLSQKLKWLGMMFLCLAFPAGLWFAFEGYEIEALIFLIFGWTPVAVLLTYHLLGEYY